MAGSSTLLPSIYMGVSVTVAVDGMTEPFSTASGCPECADVFKSSSIAETMAIVNWSEIDSLELIHILDSRLHIFAPSAKIYIPVPWLGLLCVI